MVLYGIILRGLIFFIFLFFIAILFMLIFFFSPLICLCPKVRTLTCIYRFDQCKDSSLQSPAFDLCSRFKLK